MPSAATLAKVQPDQPGDVRRHRAPGDLRRRAGLPPGPRRRPAGRRARRLDRVVRHHDGRAGELGQPPAQVGADLEPGARRRAPRAARRAAAAAGRSPARGPARPAAPGRPTARPGAWPRARPARTGPAPRRRAPCRAGRRPGRAQPEGDVLQRRQVREQQVVLEDHADLPALGRASRRRRASDVLETSRPIRPAVQRQRPASARSTVDLPAPLGRAARPPRRPRPSASVEVGTVAAHDDAAVEHRRRSCRPARGRAAPTPSARPSQRGAARTTTDTASRTSVSAIAAGGSRSQREVDRERHRLGRAREVAGERDRRAELAERPGPAEHRAGHHPGATSGRVTRRNDVPAAGAEGRGGLLEPRVGRAQRALDR